jgi:hypothetical protein
MIVHVAGFSHGCRCGQVGFGKWACEIEIYEQIFRIFEKLQTFLRFALHIRNKNGLTISVLISHDMKLLTSHITGSGVYELSVPGAPGSK